MKIAFLYDYLQKRSIDNKDYKGYEFHSKKLQDKFKI